MNKEEILQAYRHLVNEAYSRWWNYHGKSAKPGYLEFGKPMYKGDCKALLLIEQLIKEHFDNPPLKLEELKEGMWVWDNVEKEFIKVKFTEAVCIEFDPNRFYRKQVEE